MVCGNLKNLQKDHKSFPIFAIKSIPTPEGLVTGQGMVAGGGGLQNWREGGK